MSFLTFPVTGNLWSFAPGGIIKGTVRFTPNLGYGIWAQSSTDSQSIGVITASVYANVVNGILTPEDQTQTSVVLYSNDPQFNFDFDLEYTVDFIGMTWTGQPLTIDSFTFAAPADSTPVDLTSVGRL